MVGLFNQVASEQDGSFLLRSKRLSAYSPSDPTQLWIIQVGVIVCTASLLSLALKKARQPKVVAEILGGILLGPTGLGRIPGFTAHIFPEDSRPYLSLVANIGLCLFLFLVGLEIDLNIVKRHARLSTTVALAGMILPFSLGSLLSIELYKRFVDQSVQFTHFMLFTGVAYSITAFPVLCRILTELKLLDTTVGTVVLSAGVGNDIIGWVLLALSVALVNAGSGLTALYILLTCMGFTIFLLVPVKQALKWLAKITGSMDSGPSMLFMTVTMMTLFGSAFFTDIIGVHAIFGAFVTGLIVPREGGLAIALTEKLEDMVTILFLPLYFTLSGLSTDLGTLDNGVTWVFTIAIMTLAFAGKFGGCTIAAHYAAGFNWRESAAIGSLMSCKGLVELIVLNVGLQAGILSTRVFSMFVLEALVLTCLTTPLVTYFYPPQFRVRIAEKSGARFSNVVGIDDDESIDHGVRKRRKWVSEGKRSSGGGGGRQTSEWRQSTSASSEFTKVEEAGWEEKRRFMIVLDKIEHIPGALAVAQLVNPSVTGFGDDDNGGGEAGDGDEAYVTSDGGEQTDKLLENIQDEDLLARQSSTPSSSSSSFSFLSSSLLRTPPPTITPLRLIKLTDRVFSPVMKSHDTSTLRRTDPLLSIFRMFALLQGITIRGEEVEIVPEQDMTECVVGKTEAGGTEMVVVPWVLHSSSSLPPNAEQQQQNQAQTPKGAIRGPFDVLSKYGDGASPPALLAETVHQPHGHGAWTIAHSSSITHSRFIRGVFAKSDVDVGLYIDQSGLMNSMPPSPGPNEADASRSSDFTNPTLGFDRSERERGRGRIHIFLPFFGGPDDRLALEFVVGLCRRDEKLRATVVRFKKVEEGATGPDSVVDAGETTLSESGDKGKSQGDKNEETNMITPNISGFPDTVYGYTGTEVRLQSETADSIVWAQYANASTRPAVMRTISYSSASSSKSPFPPTPQGEDTLRPIMPRVTFKEIASAKPLHTALDEAYTIQQPSTWTGKANKRCSVAAAGTGVVVVAGRSRRLATESHHVELNELLQEGDHCCGDMMMESGVLREIKKTLGEVGSAFVGRGVGVGVWILQAALDGER